MIKKQHLKSRPVCKLTFELPADFEADTLELVAEWNGWEPVPFDHLKNGKWKLVQEVPPGADYPFRYRRTLGEEATWLDDESADRFEPNEFGTSNGVIGC